MPKCRIPDDRMAACETNAGTLCTIPSWLASASCSWGLTAADGGCTRPHSAAASAPNPQRCWTGASSKHQHNRPASNTRRSSPRQYGSRTWVARTTASRKRSCFRSLGSTWSLFEKDCQRSMSYKLMKSASRAKTLCPTTSDHAGSQRMSRSMNPESMAAPSMNSLNACL